MTQKEVSCLSQIRTNIITESTIESHSKYFMTVDKSQELVAQSVHMNFLAFDFYLPHINNVTVH